MKLPASKAHMWGSPTGCPAWATMAVGYPENKSESMREGASAHQLASELITHCAPLWDDWKGKQSVSGIPYTEAMFEGAKMYSEDILACLEDSGCLGINHPFTASKVSTLNTGKCDAFIHDIDSGVLWIWKYQFGYTPAEVFENWTLLNVACGLLESFKEPHGVHTVTMRIVQPRAFHQDGPVREWSIHISELNKYANILRTGANNSLDPKAKAQSASHCKRCTARHTCPASLKSGLTLYEVATQSTPLSLSPEALSVQYGIVKRASEQLEGIKAGLEEQITETLKNGSSIPGYILGTSRTHPKWRHKVDEVIKIGKEAGLDLRKKEVITPIQARKLGIDPETLNENTYIPQGKEKIISEPTDTLTKKVFIG